MQISKTPDQTVFPLDKGEKVCISLVVMVVVMLLLIGGFLALQEPPKRDYVCMNGIQYDIRNNNEFHIRLQKGRSLPCTELVSDPLGDH